MTPNSSLLTPNVSIVGAGYWGRNLVRNFHELGILKTICDQSSAIRQQMAKDYPDATVTGIGGHDAASCPPIPVLADPDIRAVVISAPAALHYEIAEKQH